MENLDSGGIPRPTSEPVSRLGDILVRGKVIDREQLRLALERQKKLGSGRLGEHLVALGFITEDTLTQQLARQFGLPIVDPAESDVSPEVLALIPFSLVRKHLILPLTLSGSTLTVSMADPTNILGLNEVKFLSGYDVRATVASARALQKALDRLYGNRSAASEALSKLSGNQLEVLKEQEVVDLEELERASEDAPVITFVNAIFAEAIRRRASDVHIEPYEKIFRVRFRIDGVLQEVMKPPPQLKNVIVSRIKIMADLDIAERRLAQDGRIKLRMGPGREIDVRVSIVPTLGGEKVVLRILDKTTTELDLSRLGFSGADLELFRTTFTQPHGMILVTGPTGSGKTTTLYAVLNEINKATINISTAEDPIEYNIAGVNQVQIQEGIGRTFSYCLRAFLRQDPDVIMVGEVRDFETAEIAIKAALTGHLVLSTLHTNDAASSVVRLLNMGFEPFLLTSALSLIVAQRLLRKLCPACKQPAEVEPEELLSLGVPAEETASIGCHQPKGCDECGGTGYLGRIAVYELLNVTESLRHYMLHSDDGGTALKQKAMQAGMKTLRQSALRRLADGVTSIEEVVRVTTPD
ncbi:MAG: type IV-A pilus assembly ATPase PilB [Candidatus Binatia bacterium]